MAKNIPIEEGMLLGCCGECELRERGRVICTHKYIQDRLRLKQA